mgnify:CR=1 FL=1
MKLKLKKNIILNQLEFNNHFDKYGILFTKFINFFNSRYFTL